VDFGLVVARLFEGFSRGFAALYVHPVVIAVCRSARHGFRVFLSLHMKVTGTLTLWILSTIGSLE
jgi:hypothetical protein